jgi:hypothetical protein
MLDPQLKQQLQTKFDEITPQLKQRFGAMSDKDWETVRRDPDVLVRTISQKTGQPEDRVLSEITTLVGQGTY